jgi:predicted SprT family Zn-dependent metalloprotease
MTTVKEQAENFGIYDFIIETIEASGNWDFEKIADAKILMGTWKLRWNSRAKNRLGMCSFRKKTIELNAFFDCEEHTPQIINTFLHELSHMFTGVLFKGRGHGKVWKDMFLMFGGSGERCTSYRPYREHQEATYASKGPKYIYGCVKCDINIPYNRKMKDSKFQNGYHIDCGTSGKIYLKECGGVKMNNLKIAA